MEKKDQLSEKKDNESSFHCLYCGKKMSKFDFETYHGVCGKCREVVDWKQVLKEFRK